MNARDELADTLEAMEGMDYMVIADMIIKSGYRKHRTIKTAEQLDAVIDGTIARGVTAGRSFYTLQFNDDGFWNQMGCDDQWDNDSLFPFFDHLELIHEPTA